jgi:REP element-mobilizing transposase RayT
MDRKDISRLRNSSPCGPNAPDQTLDDLNHALRSVPLSSYPSDLGSISKYARKRPAHGVYLLPDEPTIVYVTVCCENREPWLANDRHHELLLDIWRDSSHWIVGRYVLMPDHLHLFATPRETAVTFDSWAKYFKSQFTQRNQKSYCEWQTDHWDTRIQNAQPYEEKWRYMYDNPVRAGLVSDAREWKYKGEVYPVCWE